MKKLEEARRMVEKAEEHLVQYKFEMVYITLYSSRHKLLEIYEEEFHEGIESHLDDQQVGYDEPFVVIDKVGMEFDESVILTLSEFNDHMDLLDHVEPEYKIKGDLYEEERTHPHFQY